MSTVAVKTMMSCSPTLPWFSAVFFIAGNHHRRVNRRRPSRHQSLPASRTMSSFLSLARLLRDQSDLGSHEGQRLTLDRAGFELGVLRHGVDRSQSAENQGQKS